MNKTEKKKKNNSKLGFLEISIIIISLIILIFSFFAPSIFVKSSTNGLDFTDTGAIGDTIGGIMDPFVAIAGVLLTFLAFYIQYKANLQQKELFRKELDSNKFENQFYEMLRLHKENVNEITLSLTSDCNIAKETFINNEQIKGRECFKYYLEEIKIIYYVVKKKIIDKNPDELMNIAYSVFFHGIHVFVKKPTYTDEDRLFYDVLKDLEYINNGNRNSGTRGNSCNFRGYVSEKSDYSSATVLNYDLFKGHSAQLAHYYRHLYQTVKFITKQSCDFLSYEEKRNYLRILRSQLSNQEQAMLFYNWKSEFGKSWQNDKNKFFTDYRMIHNLYDDLIIKDFKLAEIFDIENIEYLKEKNREDDHLFEFQDW